MLSSRRALRVSPAGRASAAPYRVRVLLASFAFALSLATVYTASKAADPTTAAGPGRYQVRNCYASTGWGRIPLRYGLADRFGYRHIKARRRWSDGRIDRHVGRTLLRYDRYIPQGNGIVFLLYRRTVVDVVVVGFNRIPGAGNRDRILGVVTAYQLRWDGRRKRGYLPPNISAPPSNRCSG